MVAALATFFGSVKPRTIPSVFYIVIHLICGFLFVLILYSFTSENLSCLGIEKEYYKTLCLKLYNRGPNRLQTWLYWVYFFVPLFIITTEGFIVSIKWYWINNNGRCTLRVHLHHYFFAKLACSGTFHLSLEIYLIYISIWDRNKIRMEDTFVCLARDFTAHCIDGRTDLKSAMSFSCLGLNLVLFIVILYELLYYLPKWIALDKESQSKTNESRCRQCCLFAENFLAFQDESKQTNDNGHKGSGSDIEKEGGENVALLAIPSGSAQSGESTNGAVANGKNESPIHSTNPPMPISSQVDSGGQDESPIHSTNPPMPISSQVDDGGQGLDRSFADLNEDTLEDLAMQLNRQGVVANWKKVARALSIDPGVIQEIEANGTAHRLLFYKIRDLKPSLKLCEIKSILEDEMKKKARRDIFYDYERKDNLPALDRELGSLNHTEFRLVLKKVADRLIAYRTRGSWRDLGGHLGFNPTDLDSIQAESALDQSTSRARIFLDYLLSQDLKLRDFLVALNSDGVRRKDVYSFMMKRIKCHDCWAEG